MEYNYLLQQYKNFEHFNKDSENYHLQKNIKVIEQIYEMFRARRKLKYSFTELKNCTKLCNSRYEIKNRFPNVYEFIRRLNLLDILCIHMHTHKLAFSEKVCQQISSKLFKVPYLINTRKIISPYELDIFFPSLKIAIEFQGEYWHSRETTKIIDDIKKTKCEENGILLICIYEQGHSHQDNIKIIQKQFIDQLPRINDFLNSNYQNHDIITDIDIDAIYDSHKPIDEYKIISNYKNLKEFSKKEKTVYNRILKTNKLHLLEPLRERKYPYKWKLMTDSEIIELIKSQNFSSFREFSKQETFRTICRRRNLIGKIKEFFL